MDNLPIIQKTYDLIKWYVPILNKLPRNHKFLLGDRIITELYDFLESLIFARYAKEKLAQLELLNAKLDILRHQTRLLLDFELISWGFASYQIASECERKIYDGHDADCGECKASAYQGLSSYAIVPLTSRGYFSVYGVCVINIPKTMPSPKPLQAA